MQQPTLAQRAARRLTALAVTLHLWAPPALGAEAVVRDPLDYPLKQYAFMLAIALLGGLVSWWAKVRRNEIPATSITQLVGELATSAFAGLLIFWLCEWANWPPLLTAASVAMGGHMGARTLVLIEGWAKKRAGIVDGPREGQP